MSVELTAELVEIGDSFRGVPIATFRISAKEFIRINLSRTLASQLSKGIYKNFKIKIEQSEANNG